MKNFKVFALALVTAFALYSCSNVEKILPKKDGRWNVTSQTDEEYVDGVLITTTSTTDSLPTWQFNSDGTGEVFEFGGASAGTINWVYDDNNETVTITQDGIGLAFSVIESSKDAQTWTSSIEFEVLGVVSRTDSRYQLARAE